MSDTTKTEPAAAAVADERRPDSARCFRGYGGGTNYGGADMDGVTRDDEGGEESRIHDARATLIKERLTRGSTRRERSEDTPVMDRGNSGWGAGF